MSLFSLVILAAVLIVAYSLVTETPITVVLRTVKSFVIETYTLASTKAKDLWKKITK